MVGRTSGAQSRSGMTWLRWSSLEDAFVKIGADEAQEFLPSSEKKPRAREKRQKT